MAMSRSTPPAMRKSEPERPIRAGIEVDSDTSDDAHREIGDAEQDRQDAIVFQSVSATFPGQGTVSFVGTLTGFFTPR
jgi:hypothetical protein